ncbi:inositol monophosphatase 1-like [Polypterus senegalus]|uniref:inositol monophosphatase 1-like n=1 Tax=Polypterus senegalus TaxID=55291 RepID=UPI001962FBF9|nr:inositol monophosphatase 1-like [Polypterus senegalus]
MSDLWQDCMDFAILIARKAGEVICEAFENNKSVMLKSSPADLVTETDRKVEEMIISSIEKKFPDHRFIAEESVTAGAPQMLTDGPTWLIDPLDGTTNFVHGFPLVAVSIAFAVNKEIEFGIVYSCLENKMYTARKGKGAFCNGKQLRTSGQEETMKSIVITEVGTEREAEILKILFSNMERLLNIPIHGIRAAGSAAIDMCLVATGGADAYYHIGMHCWDIAAASLIVTEAGGVVMDTNGGPFDLMSRRVIAASSTAVGERIAEEIQVFPCERDDGSISLTANELLI